MTSQRFWQYLVYLGRLVPVSSLSSVRVMRTALYGHYNPAVLKR